MADDPERDDGTAAPEESALAGSPDADAGSSDPSPPQRAPEEAADASAQSAAPAKGSGPDEPTKRKKRRGRRSSASESGQDTTKTAPPLPGAGTPDGDKLAHAHAAFAAGDYARVRRLCDELGGARRDDVAAAARDLRRRTQIDPMQVAVIVLCLILFVAIAYTYVF